MRYLEIRKLKDKFGTLISILNNELGIELDLINERILISSYFDSFESEKINDFVDDSFEKIISLLFEFDCNIAYKENKSELYWAGIQYINIFLNYQIPLKTIFLLMPLNETINNYYIYHEMNEKEFCNLFIDRYYKKSILKNLIDKEYSLRELSFLTDIPEPSLKALLKNDNLFKSSNSNIDKISTVLNVSNVFFRKNSNLLINDYYLYKNNEFINILTDNIKVFFNFKKDFSFVDGIKKIEDGNYILLSPDLKLNSKEIKELLKKSKVVITTFTTATMFRKLCNATNTENIERQYSFIFKKSLDEYLKIKRDNLYF